MNLEIFEPKHEKGKVVQLRLSKVEGGIDLDAVDENGDWLGGHLLKIRNDGSLLLYGSIQENLGFRLTNEGRLSTDCHF